MADERYVVRNQAGAGVVFKTKKEAEDFLKSDAGKAYSLEGSGSKAVKAGENKAVNPDENKEPNPLQALVPGLQAKAADVLLAAGYDSLEKLAAASDEELTALDNVAAGSVRSIREVAPVKPASENSGGGE